MEYSVITDTSGLDYEKWDRFIKDHPYGNYFQSPVLYEIYKKTKYFDSLLIYAENSDNEICAILLAFIWTDTNGIIGNLTKRTVVYGGPIIKPHCDKEILSLILAALVKKVKKESVYIQFRNFYNTSSLKDIFLKFGLHFKKHLNYVMDVSAKENIYKSISKSKQRQIRKTLDAGARIITADDINQVRSFFCLLGELYKTRVYKPLPNWSFFKSFYQSTLSNPGTGCFLLIEHNGNIIGGALCPVFNGKVIYEWYICGQDLKYKSLNIYPSVLATWAIIDYAIKNNLKYVDFMGIGKPDVYYGVREFKTKFNGEILDYGRYERINRKIIYSSGRLGLKLLGSIRKINRTNIF